MRLKNVLFLNHQTSDKKLLLMSGEGWRCLIEPESWSHESPDSHSEKAEVWIKAEMLWFVNKKNWSLCVQFLLVHEVAEDGKKPWFLIHHTESKTIFGLGLLFTSQKFEKTNELNGGC